MRAVVVQHVPFEGPAMIAHALADAGCTVDVVRTDLGQDLPDSAGVDVLVVMGGPMGALDDAEHPHLEQERSLLAACVQRDIPVLGVCLGAQLLAAALGARVRRGPAPEIGLGEVRLTDAGEADPVLGTGPGRTLPVLHWHEDTFDLPERAVLLASSDAYAHQAFRAGRAYGLQFHVELDGRAFESVRPHLPAAFEAADCAAVEEAGREVLAGWARSIRPARTDA